MVLRFWSPGRELSLTGTATYDGIRWHEVNRSYLKKYFPVNTPIVPEFKPALFRQEKNPHTFRVFCLDTGRLHAETYQFLERVREHYKIEIEAFFPQPEAVQKLVREKGLFSFYKDGHKECCGVRKVEPLVRALRPLKAWVTGQRKDQSPGTRADVPVVQVDPTFGSPERTLVKFNPLAHWTSKQVWAYIREHDVPYNVLHDRGFSSIGCEPCTRSTNPGQHEREGRWWWEEETMKECGLHAGNVK